MNRKYAEEIVGKLKNMIMIPICFQDVNLTILDVHSVNYADHDWLVPEHYHPWYEFIFMVDGSYYTTIQLDKILLKQNDVLLIPPGYMHSHSPDGDNLTFQMCIRFKFERLYQNGILYNEINNLFQKNQKINIDMKFDKLLQYISNTSHIKNILGIWEWILELCGNSLNSSHNPISFSQALVYQANLYIEKNFNQDINAETIAQILNVSYRTLARHYKEETGMTINKKIITVRLTRAQNMLINTDDKIKTIASKVGYNDVYYFSSLFKKETNRSPQAYRKDFSGLKTTNSQQSTSAN